MKFLAAKLLRVVPDKWYIKGLYLRRFHRNINLKTPQTFNEKLNWLKLYDRKPFYNTLVDKYVVKKYVANKIGEQYIIPTLGVWKRAEDIEFDKLPNQFVLKCNHFGGGDVIICRDKSKLNKKETIDKLSRQLKYNLYWFGREWVYRDISPCVIAEKYLEDNQTHELRDYKFFCFNGEVDCVMVCVDRSTEAKFYFFSDKWELLRINRLGKNAPKGFALDKPVGLEKMFEIAALLSKGIAFVRVDLYNCNNKIYFGELTLCPTSGFDANLLPETDQNWGRKLVLPSKEK